MKTHSTHLSLLLLPVTALAIASCKGASATEKASKVSPPRLVEVVTLRQKTRTPTLSTVGKSEPNRQLLVSVEMPGKLTHVPHEVGAQVKSGELLARVRSLGLWSQRKAARANVSLVTSSLDQAKRDYLNVQRLYGKGVVSRNEYDRAKLSVATRSAQLRSARASYSQINSTIGGTSVVAPFNGLITHRNYEPGSFVPMGVPILRLIDLSKVKIRVGLSELDVSHVKVGDSVTVLAVALPKARFTGVISSISPAVESRSGLFPVEVLLENRKGEKGYQIREGMTMKVRFHSKPVGGLFVPEEAVILRKGNRSVWVITAQPKAATQGEEGKRRGGYGVRLVPLKIDHCYEGWCRISKGLHSGDRVVTTSVVKLRKDSIVRPLPSTRKVGK